MSPPEEPQSDPGAETIPATRRDRLGVRPHAGPESLPAIQLEIVGGPMDGVTAHARGETLVIGRSPGSDLCLHLDPRISGRHARVVRDGAAYWLEDLNSRNGTYVGEQRIRERTLIGPGTQFVVGNTCVEFMPAGGTHSF